MSAFVEHLHEVFNGLGPITARKMFGGWGVYHDGVMFGLVANDELYLKVDDTNRADFEALGLEAFVYDKQGKQMEMSYYQAPEFIFDDPDEAERWARKAWEIAWKTKASKSKKKPKANG